MRAVSFLSLESLETQEFDYIKSLHELGRGKRCWDDIEVGDKLPMRIFGPHSIAGFTTEWRA